SLATLGDSDQMQVGQPVYAIGNPLGELEYTMTGGIVSALDREIRTEEAVAINMFQIDAAVNSGNSGGPVYDAAGRVIGIVTAKYSESGVEGLGFAVPINDAVTIAQQLMENGYVTGKAYLGVSVQDIDRRYAEYYNMPRGAYITGVEEDSCAQKAGLSAGDVITAVAGVQIVSTQELKAALRAHSAGETVELTVYRAGVQSAVQVILDEYIPQENTVPPLQTR
ncbi:MAG: PDZ domain-containing protein, partial [Clostridia bacterium]|nr:PDZ domain-containing protein [Clostridia bacterium]